MSSGTLSCQAARCRHHSHDPPPQRTGSSNTLSSTPGSPASPRRMPVPLFRSAFTLCSTAAAPVASAATSTAAAPAASAATSTAAFRRERQIEQTLDPAALSRIPDAKPRRQLRRQRRRCYWPHPPAVARAVGDPLRAPIWLVTCVRACVCAGQALVHACCSGPCFCDRGGETHKGGQ